MGKPGYSVFKNEEGVQKSTETKAEFVERLQATLEFHKAWCLQNQIGVNEVLCQRYIGSVNTIDWMLIQLNKEIENDDTMGDTDNRNRLPDNLDIHSLPNREG